MNLALVTVCFAFISNFLWENAHARLYTHHLEQPITQKVLFIATLGDVLILSIFALLWYYIPFLNKHFWFVVPLGLVVAYAIEKYAFATNRWAYTEAMSVVPYAGVGLSPFLQLALTSFLMILLLRYLSVQ